jgi:hypothetical protein
VPKAQTTRAMALDDAGLPSAADRATYEAEIERLRVPGKAHTREADAIAAPRRVRGTPPDVRLLLHVVAGAAGGGPV